MVFCLDPYCRTKCRTPVNLAHVSSDQALPVMTRILGPFLEEHVQC